MSQFRIATPADLADLLEPSNETMATQKLSGGGSVSPSQGYVQRDINSRPGGPPTAPSNPTTLSNLEPIKCDNAYEFHGIFWTDMVLYPWQRETLLQLSGFSAGDLDDGLTHLVPTIQAPLQYSLVAANGSGKSAAIIARFALWFIATKCNSIAVVTSATFAQLKNLTFRAIKRAAEDINATLGEEFFIVTECHVECPKTRSFIHGFATDEPGRAEGWHPEFGGELAILIDEAKTIDDEMFKAFSRFTGFSYWIEVSSPGSMSGHFFRRVTSAQDWAIGSARKDVLKLGANYSRRVTAFENPHISQAHIDQIKLLEGGESGMLYKSSILAEFTSLDDAAVIKQETTIYPAPQWCTYDQPLRAGLDLSLGGDETVLSVWHGNKRIAQRIWRLTDSAILRDTLIKAFAEYGLEAENINADGGGLGKVVIQMIQASGWVINHINNESSAVYKREFLNRGMEMYWRVKRLIEEKILILPHEDTVCMTQLVTRRCEASNGKLKLESKKNLSTSPDRADAMVLAFASVPLDEILAGHKLLLNPPQQVSFIPPPPTLDQLLAFIDARRATEQAGNKIAKGNSAFTDFLVAVRPQGISNFLRSNNLASKTKRF